MPHAAVPWYNAFMSAFPYSPKRCAKRAPYTKKASRYSLRRACANVLLLLVAAAWPVHAQDDTHDVTWGVNPGDNRQVNEAFKRTGVPREQFKVTKWGKNAHGKSLPVEWRAKDGAVVNLDLGHKMDGPGVPHVGYQTPGKRSAGAVRGHILLDDVPANR